MVSTSSMSPQCNTCSTPRWRSIASARRTLTSLPCESLTMPIFMVHLPRCLGPARARLDRGLDKEVVAPGHRLVHPQALVVVIDAVHQDALPLRLLARQELVRA